MPNYRLVARPDRGAEAQSLGFYSDEGAISYTRRIARAEPIEVWRGDDLVAVVERPSAADGAPR